MPSAPLAYALPALVIAMALSIAPTWAKSGSNSQTSNNTASTSSTSNTANTTTAKKSGGTASNKNKVKYMRYDMNDAQITGVK